MTRLRLLRADAPRAAVLRQCFGGLVFASERLQKSLDAETVPTTVVHTPPRTTP